MSPEPQQQSDIFLHMRPGVQEAGNPDVTAFQKEAVWLIFEVIHSIRE